jgi:hypothetical protein
MKPLVASLRENAERFATRALDQGVDNPATLRGLIELCRQSGSLDLVRRLSEVLARLDPQDRKAQFFSALLNQRAPAPDPVPGEAWPSPFVRFVDFLAPADHAEVVSTALSLLAEYEPSAVNVEGHGRLDSSRRESLILPGRHLAPIAAHFAPLVRAAAAEHNVYELLGIDSRSLGSRYELQVTCSGDGAFFKPHTDGQYLSNSARALSFVYYFYKEPKGFEGGDLVLYDFSGAEGRYATKAFTRVPPLNNSIIFFPSSVVHEVEPVHLPSKDLTAARFTINGWMHTAETV